MNCHDCPNALLGLNACALLVADRDLIDCSLPRDGAREDCPERFATGGDVHPGSHKLVGDLRISLGEVGKAAIAAMRPHAAGFSAMLHGRTNKPRARLRMVGGVLTANRTPSPTAGIPDNTVKSAQERRTA